MLLLGLAVVALSIRLATSSCTSDASEEESTESEAIECIMTRASVRSYSDKVVDSKTIEKILKAGMAAPCAANQQAWEFVVITDDALKSRISDSFQYMKMVKDCAFAVVVCGNMDKLFEGDREKGGFWVQDCSAASENMLLAAHALGLGGVWCGVYPDEDRIEIVKSILDLPSNLTPLNILSFGYPNATVSPKDKWEPSNIHYNSY